MISWQAVLEILILWVAIYYMYRAFRATRAARILVGMAFVFLVVAFFATIFKLEVINFLLREFLGFLAIALVVLFQPELRSALARLGSSRLFKALNLYEDRQSDFVDDLILTVVTLSKKRIGALIAVEQGILLKELRETGTLLDSVFSEDLCHSVFFPKSPLHDGGMIVKGDRIVAAGCIFPISNDYFKDRSLGLRHRAAIGVTQESDALAIIVSEETGNISLCLHGELMKNLNEDELREQLRLQLLTQEGLPVDQQLEE